MTTPTGTIGFTDINTELGRATNTPNSNLNETPVRNLAGGSAVTPDTLISFDNLRGKTLSTNPKVTFSRANNSLPITATETITFTLSEPSTNFGTGDITSNVIGGILGNISGSGSVYTATWQPPSGVSGTVTFTSAENTFTGQFSSSQNILATGSFEYDTSRPTVTASPTAPTVGIGGTQTITFTTSETTTNFDVSDITLTPATDAGTIGSFSGSGTTYSVVYSPPASGTGTCTLSIPAGSAGTPKFTDSAGNHNQAMATNVVITYDLVRPSISSIVASPSSISAGQTSTLTITMNEAIQANTFSNADLTASIGTIGATSPSSGTATTFTATYTPPGSGTGTATITQSASALFSDVANNTNTTSSASASINYGIIVDRTPNAFTFTDISDATLSTVYTSSTLTLTGFSANASGIQVNVVTGSSAASALVDAGTSSLSGTFATSKTVTASASGTIVIAARVTSSSSNSAAANCVVQVGETGNFVQDTYTVTTAAAPIDSTPNVYTIPVVYSAALNTDITSSTVTVSGMTPSTSITVSVISGTGTVDAGTSSLSGTFSSSKTVTTSGSGSLVIAVKLRSSKLSSQSTTCTVQVGSGATSQATFEVITGVPAYDSQIYIATLPEGSTQTINSNLSLFTDRATARGLVEVRSDNATLGSGITTALLNWYKNDAGETTFPAYWVRFTRIEANTSIPSGGAAAPSTSWLPLSAAAGASASTLAHTIAVQQTGSIAAGQTSAKYTIEIAGGSGGFPLINSADVTLVASIPAPNPGGSTVSPTAYNGNLYTTLDFENGYSEILLEYRSNGSYRIYDNMGNPETTGSWYNPNSAGIGNNYWVRFSIVSSSLTYGGQLGVALNQWLRLDLAKDIGVYCSNGTQTSRSAQIQYNIDIADNSSGTPILNTQTITLRATAYASLL